MKLFAHQQRGLDRGRDRNLALFWDCGTGKTVTALNLIRHHGGKALVVCPLSIIEPAWVADCKRFTPELKIASLWSKDPKQRLAQLNGDATVHVINYEGLKNLYEELAAQQYNVLIVDESSKIKNWKSQITRAILSFAGVTFKDSPYRTEHIIPHRYCLSGTPAPNGMEEYWAQITFVAPNGALPQNYFAFRGRFFTSKLMRYGKGKPFKQWTFKAEKQTEFMDRMKEVADVVRKEDAVDLPEQMHVIRSVHLGESERVAYDEMKKHLACKVRDASIIAPTVMAEIMKLRQITSGFAYCSDGVGRRTIHIGRSKLEELQAVLEEIGDSQVLIWANFREEIEWLSKTLKAPALYSQTPDRNEVVRCFQGHACRYLVANPQSAGHGLTFQNCNYCIYFSLNYSYELWKQSMDRIHRIGQENKCTYYYLLGTKTIDEVIYNALQSKQNLSEAVLTYLKG